MQTDETQTPAVPTESTYVLDNAGKEASARFPALSGQYDPGTIRHLETLGVSSGWNCLEVGGGGGSIAAWLADRVGPTGQVVATDIDPRYLQPMGVPNLQVRRHDISSDPLPEAAFDLVHARLVLMHIPEREAALARMVSALKPGGWILEEEFDSAVFPDPLLNPGEILSKTHVAMTRLMDARGVDRTFGRSLFGHLRALGLVSVAAEGRTFMWPSGSAGPSLLHANYQQLRTGMIARGYLTEQQFDQDLAGLQDPAFLMPSPVLWAAWGRKPSH
ncbi:MAG: methyltransferase domain-containing protein [Acidobacteriaceae bacterium]